ncbi:MAG: sulfotransferase family protein, partial [Gammaproteobacteria bacterium]|nr:sulfotransferase family protein [Gammaproteobacteria bacterium]
MHPIYILWATPRSTSTAFEWMMRMRGDLACFHEPFGEAWYQGDDARAPRLTATSSRKPGLNFDRVLENLRQAAARRAVFAKDIPQFTEHLWSDRFLDRFEHSFLIRDPAKVPGSLQRSWLKAGHEGFTRNEIGFDQQRELFDRLRDKTGRPPVVIDSDDNIWHETLKNSNGIIPQARKPADISGLPPRLQDLYHAFLPHYR